MYVCVYTHTTFYFVAFIMTYSDLDEISSAKSIIIVLILYFKFMFHLLYYNFLTFALSHYILEKFWKFL